MPKIRHIAIISPNPDRLADFYVTHFGLEKIKRGSDGAVWVTDGHVKVALLQLRPETPEQGINHFGIEVEESDKPKIFAKLEESGFQPMSSPPNRPYVEEFIYDVDGNKVDVSTTGLRLSSAVFKESQGQ
jgi:catechol 2,3-dioxygenase-like lactoylglutathione lyase family enzyme